MPEDRPIKALYLSDWNGDHADELQMIKEQVKDALGYDLEIEHIQQPPFDKYTSTSQSFDILFFDYGGAGVVGNSMFEHMTHALLQDAEDHPSRVYIVTSSFTWDYMREAREAFADKVHNVFVSSAMAHDDHDQGFEELKKALTMAGLKVVA